jgi:hypothetical protein
VRKLFVLLGAALLVLGTSGTALASVLNWEGTNTLLLGDFPKANGVRGGGVATINGTSSLGHINTLRLAASRGQIKGTFTQLVTDPDTINNGIYAIQYDGVAGGTGTVGPISGGAMSTTTLSQNTMSLTGTVRICLVSTDCASALILELAQMTQNGQTIGVGIGGLLTVGADSNVKISIQGAPWTIKTAKVQDQITTTGEVNQLTVTVTLSGFAHSAASSTSSTAAPSGVVQLVTPSQVHTNLPLGSNKLVASGQTFFLHFIPEPGLLLLLGSGVAGLALLGRHRMRK